MFFLEISFRRWQRGSLNPSFGSSSRAGFSLVELLVVMAIAAILTVGVLLAIPSLVSSYDLNTSGTAFSGQLDLARQRASTLNAVEEVRFYRYVVPGFPNEPGQGNFRAYQLIENDQPFGRLQLLSGRVIFASPSTTSMSPLLAATVETTTASAGILPAGTSYVSIFLRPNGTVYQSSGNSGTLVPLSVNNNYVTMVDGSSKADPPANFVTFIIDPVSSICKMMRP